jgi:uncharacterized protein (DUF1501 family)
MAISRRKFLNVAAAGTCGAAIHNILSPVGDFMAFADPGAAASTMGTRTLVLVFFGGGCSYNIANPTNGLYLDENPNVAYQPGVGAGFGQAISSEQVLHPALNSMKTMFDAGELAVLNMVGYPNPNRSHDESTKIWQTGYTSGYVAAGGWGAKVACSLGTLFSGISLTGSNTLTEGTCLTGGGFTSLSSLSNSQSNFWWESSLGNLFMANQQALVNADIGPLPGPKAQYVTEQMSSYDTVVKTVAGATNFNLNTAFPNTGIGQQFANAAKLIAAPTVPVKLIYLGFGGFDTHSGERQSLANLMTQLNAALAAFRTEMISRGRWNDVAVMTMSEFGRTFENGSQGTDHGHASPMFLMGGRVAGGIKSPAPTTAQIQSAISKGYLDKYDVDFREALAAGIQWIGANPSQFFPAYSSKGLQLFI